MNINSLPPAANLLPVVYGQQLPQRYVLSPVNRVSAGDLYPDSNVMRRNDYYAMEKSLYYRQERMTGSVKIVTLSDIHQKATLVDLMV